jgi:two-component system cell cycle response regulator DivK
VSTDYRILLVEDEDDDLVMLTQLIQSVMHQDVAVARDGLEAIRMAQSEHFHLVLLDLRLPNLQGFDVAEALRQMEAYRHVPIIALTAYDLADTRERCLAAGCNEYLTKPIDIDRFVQLLSDYLTPAK